MKSWIIALIALAACGDAAVESIVVDISCEVDEDCAKFENRYCLAGTCHVMQVPCETADDCDPAEGPYFMECIEGGNAVTV